MKKKGDKPSRQYEDIELPKNTGMGIYISVFGFLLGFAIVWHILWLGLLGAIGVVACLTMRSLDKHTEYTLSAAEIARIEKAKDHGR